MIRSHWPVLAIALIFGGGVTLFFLMRHERNQTADEPSGPALKERVTEEVAEGPDQQVEPIPALVPDAAETAEELANEADAMAEGFRSPDQAKVVERLGQALEAGDVEAFGRLLGSEVLSPEERNRLSELAASGALKLRPTDAMGEVGELEINERTRWALYLEGAEPGRDRILLDLEKKQGTWGVTKIVLPPDQAAQPVVDLHGDALGNVDAFLQSALQQNFEQAKEFVDVSTVSDAKIAGLCILFEEGDYQLRREKPLRAMFQREDTAGFLAHVVTPDDANAAQFSVTARQTDDGSRWLLTEINLDQLLADYARRVAGGDVYYTPLVRNPKGGDTLVLYFDFDDETLTERTQRQLGIVAEILKTDPDNRLTISGHTDALGTEEYNEQLSSKRAASVKQSLVALGVDERQIVTVAQGQTEPRRPNFTESGADNPSGRRANRRTEIYLDF